MLDKSIVNSTRLTITISLEMVNFSWKNFDIDIKIQLIYNNFVAAWITFCKLGTGNILKKDFAKLSWRNIKLSSSSIISFVLVVNYSKESTSPLWIQHNSNGIYLTASVFCKIQNKDQLPEVIVGMRNAGDTPSNTLF